MITKQVVNGFCFTFLMALSFGTQAQTKEPDRTILPFPHPEHPLITEPDVKKEKMPERVDLTAPKEALNVVVIMINYIGFGVTEAF